jgi:hypothetical protein
MFLLLDDRLQRVAGFSDPREIDLGTRLIRRKPGAATIARPLELIQNVLAYANRLVFLDGAGVGFFLGHAYLW